jgi:hypothetical protein
MILAGNFPSDFMIVGHEIILMVTPSAMPQQV